MILLIFILRHVGLCGIVSLFFKKEKKEKKEREDIHNQSINHWYPTHLSCILEGLYG